MSDPPPRVMDDPKALRAVAHPVRIGILEELVFHGTATATELAERTGESPANCSWHLRQLAKYGFVEETGGGTGRQRPWQTAIQPKRLPHGGQWADAAFVLQNLGWCTAEELAEVRREVTEAMDRFADRVNHAERRPPGARPVRFFGWGIPAGRQ